MYCICYRAWSFSSLPEWFPGSWAIWLAPKGVKSSRNNIFQPLLSITMGANTEIPWNSCFHLVSKTVGLPSLVAIPPPVLKAAWGQRCGWPHRSAEPLRPISTWWKSQVLSQTSVSHQWVIYSYKKDIFRSYDSEWFWPIFWTKNALKTRVSSGRLKTAASGLVISQRALNSRVQAKAIAEDSLRRGHWEPTVLSWTKDLQINVN